MKKYFLVGLSVAGGFLSSLAWSGWCSGLILLISFVPFFIIENYLYENRKRYSPNAFFIYVLPGFLIFSMVTLAWIRVASIVAAVAVITGICFLISFTVWLAHIVRLRSGNLLSVIAVISFWLFYEFLSLNIDIITPWVNLGNGLAKDIKFIQWYEITGTSGGTLWILLSNITLSAILIKSDSGLKKNRMTLIIWLVIIILPSLLSFKRYYSLKPAAAKESEIVIVQPNFDPYTAKFTIPFDKQLRKAISMAESVTSDNTQWVITPETTVDDPVNEAKHVENKYINMFREFAGRFPYTGVVTGMTSYILYPATTERPTKSARFVDSLNTFYDHFNSALKIDTSVKVEIYHKSKLVPGIEKQFATGPGKLISRILPYLGGSQWGYGKQEERISFNHSVSDVKVAPIICYESVFGKYVSDYVKKGANLLFIITNDGWWKNTNGYEQHFSYASIRAIETRRPVARSGNTGISAFIDFKGRIINKTEWWTEATLKGTLTPEKRITPYVKYGDLLLKIGTISAVIVLLIVFPGFHLHKKYNQRK
ncbi:MAG: apolipoprotein N-acyltransferase [Odoribacter sp.]|nr:apolipoprotein N-acyltransferase [Odoribacter sp.]